MSAVTDSLDLGGLRLSAGEGRCLELAVQIEPLILAGESYGVGPAVVPVRLDLSRMTGNGYALRLRFAASIEGMCMRCLRAAAPRVEVDAREVDTLKGAPKGHTAGRPGGGDELSSPYLEDETLNLVAWARDALMLALPAQILCDENCAGLCPVCAINLNDLDSADLEHTHERAPDPRWSKLSELKLE